MAITIEGKVTFTGAVLATRERNGYDDSDFYAIVWDGERLVDVTYGTTRCQLDGTATPDVTDEVLETVRTWLAAMLARFATSADRAAAREVERENRIVRVVRGRKIPRGTVGRVVRVAESNFGTFGSKTYRLQLDTGAGDRLWVSADNCEVVDPEQYETAPEVFVERARQRTAEAGANELAGLWASMMAAPGWAVL